MILASMLSPTLRPMDNYTETGFDVKVKVTQDSTAVRVPTPSRLFSDPVLSPLMALTFWTALLKPSTPSPLLVLRLL